MSTRHYRETPVYSDLLSRPHLTALRASPRIGSWRARPVTRVYAGATP